MRRRRRKKRFPKLLLGIVIIALALAAYSKFSSPRDISVTLFADPADSAVLTGGGEYSRGDEITVSAAAAEGWEFLYWTADSQVVAETPDYSFVVEEEANLKAHFKAMDYSIAVSARGEGSVQGSREEVLHGDTVTVQALPASGHEFSHWEEGGEAVSNDAEYSFTGAGNRSLVAVFVPIDYPLSVEVSGEGAVAQAWTYEPQVKVTLTATAREGYEFFGWVDKATGQEIETKPVLSFAWSQDRNLVARFRKELVFVDGSNLLAVVGKQTTIGQYEPDDLEYLPEAYGKVFSTKLTPRLRRDVADALDIMYHEAKVDGVNLFVVSAYRSYQTQHNLFYDYVKNRGGVFQAETFSARPGQSEHQLGTAMDFGGEGANDFQDSFGDTPQGKWLMENAYKYGFVMSYPRDSSEITGYKYEPWHYRYIGKDMALEWKESGLTLIEFLRTVN